MSPNFNEARIIWVFIILHFLLYPASNGYNSYFDKDEKSIGGLKNPPPVNKGLYYLSLILDIVAVILGYIKLNLIFATMLLIYGLVSKAYSHPAIRLKKYALTGLIITGVFQGLFTFIMCYIGLNDYDLQTSFKPDVLIPGFLACLMLWANYPITQIYQHEEDSKRGDKTFSLLLGVRGTLYFAASVFGITVAGFLLYFKFFFGSRYAFAFIVVLLPVLLYFTYWFLLVLKDRNKADFTHTMRLTFISATCLNGFFIYLFLNSSQVLQAIQAGF